MEKRRMLRLEVLVEEPALSRVERALEAVSADGWTIMPAISGVGTTGAWSREGQIGAAGRRMMVVVLVGEEVADIVARAVIDSAGPLAGPLAMIPADVIVPEG